MQTPFQIRSAVEREIRTAFRGITLGREVSLRQAEIIDGSQAAGRDALSASPAPQEITDDWSQVSRDDLDRDCIAHLDALGFRYYIPALMLSVLDHYDPSSLRVIGTLRGLYLKEDEGWEYHIRRYSLLDFNQKAAIARFLAALPELVQLDLADQKCAERALRNYWGQFLRANMASDGTRE